MPGELLAVLLGHVARRSGQKSVAERDLAEEVLARRLALLGGVEHGGLVPKRDRLEQIAGEEGSRPRTLPVLLVVWSMLSRTHARRPFGRRSVASASAGNGSVDGAGADRRHVVVRGQRGEAAEHLLAQLLDVLRTEAPDTARQPDGMQQPALLPTSNSVLVDPESLGCLSDLHELRHERSPFEVESSNLGGIVEVGEVVDFGPRQYTTDPRLNPVGHTRVFM